MPKPNPYSLPRGEYGVGITSGEHGTVIMTTKGAYRLEPPVCVDPLGEYPLKMTPWRFVPIEIVKK